jgi:ERCC4-related helicase
MSNYTLYQARYFAEQITLKRPNNRLNSLVPSLAGAKVDLNPHQVDAALFAFKSPLSSGVILADEVGLGKTIEAGIIMAQYWAEHKRKILLIVPASLRNQWLSELSEKFYIKSIILESKNFNSQKKKQIFNPFNQKDEVVICSYNFAARKQKEVSNINWNLVVIDEAHRLRNVYKNSNVTGNKLKSALRGRKKLLLTATPLQNNLMELYGLVSIIDERVFSDPKTFRQKYVNVENEEVRNVFLRARLQQFCKRTLRKQVVEYVPYTKREAILVTYAPSAQEEKLYNEVSEYLQSPTLYALPNSQRKLMTMILRKLLASSSFAISGTLDALVVRLENMLNGIDSKLNLDDYDSIDELFEEDSVNEDETKIDMLRERININKELAKLKEYANLAKSINTNAKGENLLIALKKGFARTEELGGNRRVVIFTESRRTQEYLYKLLSLNEYENKIVFLNGSNNDSNSKRIYKEWLKRHKGEDIVSGSKQADMKAAIVEEFKERANILIGTEAASEGINLQFCSLLVNYDMPWNPQRIEQRIGRCHRYGQKNDVVVINFVNEKNEADKRVYELLNEKFKLFEGLFGSSDEVLGSIESGVDFENKIAEIYQNCRTKDEIKVAFDNLQEQFKDKISDTMKHAQQSLLENFDEEVSALLKTCNDNTIKGINQYEKWLYNFMISSCGDKIKPIDNTGFEYISNDNYRGTYSIRWKESERNHEHFLRREHPLCEELIKQIKEKQLPVSFIEFNYKSSDRKISYLDVIPCKTGWICIDKLISDSFDKQEHLIISAICDDGTVLDSGVVNKIMELSTVKRQQIECSSVPNAIKGMSKTNADNTLKQIEMENKEYFLKECEKLDEWSEDLKDGLQEEIKNIDKVIKEKNRELSIVDCTLEEMLDKKDEILKLKKLRDKKRRKLYDEEDRIENENEKLQEEMRQRIKGKNTVTNIFTIRFEIV